MSGNTIHEGEESDKLGGDFLFSQEDLQRRIRGLEDKRQLYSEKSTR